MTLGSLFDGIGGFPLAGVRHGIEPIWASEIEPFPILVTRKRFPKMEHLGSVTEINGAEIAPVDIITFGSPCQDLSVAGKMAGIHEGKRSNLFFEAIRIIKEMRARDRAIGRTDAHARPRFAVWENVPGAYSSNGGGDFCAVLQALCSVADESAHVPMPAKGKWGKAGCIVGDGYSVAWRTYDAQYWGVPQRRKRIYLVADFGSERAGEILFECESVPGDFEPCQAAREGTADDASESAGGSDRLECLSVNVQQDPISNTKISPCVSGQAQASIGVAAFMGGQGGKAGGIGYSEDTVPTLKSTPSGGNTVPDVVYQNTGIGWWNEAKVAETIRTPCGGDSTKANLVVYDAHGNGNGAVVPTLTGDHESRVTDYTAVCVKTYGVDCWNGVLDEKKTHTLQSEASGGQSLNCTPCVLLDGKPPRRYIVRRLTPLECCRLQGYPDGWTQGVAIQSPSEEEISFFSGVWAAFGKPKTRKQVAKWLRNPQSDSAEYKAYGNSLAMPCAEDVIGRIQKEMRASEA